MREYEICILKDDGSPSIIKTQMQLNDYAAIRSAQRLAKGRTLQVWRGGDCIYGVTAKPFDGASAFR